MDTKPIVALDFSSAEEITNFLDLFGDEQLYVKVGMELYYNNGPQVINWIKSRGHQIFLDLKLHDIPNTVKRAMRGLAEMNVDMVNVHAAGGIQMMEAAMDGIIAGTKAGHKRPNLIAVTQLTSTTEEQMHSEQLIQVKLMDSVLHYAHITEQAGLDGVVCSARESLLIKNHTNSNFLTVTPGIRPEGTAVGDQKRVATPAYARVNKASGIVVGRPITLAENPLEAYLEIKRQWMGE